MAIRNSNLKSRKEGMTEGQSEKEFLLVPNQCSSSMNSSY